MGESVSNTYALPAFGTAHLMGRIGQRQSARLVHAALDCGIDHFDTARVYGLGDAEWMLGRALRGRPDVSVYTKVGQGRSTHSRVWRQIHAVGRPLAQVRGHIARSGVELPGPSTFVRRTNFSRDHVRTSIETSLRLLRRDTIDGLLLHEITQGDFSPELLELLDGLVLEGKIRRYGVASEPRTLVTLNASGIAGGIVQQAGGPFVDPVGFPSSYEVVLHSLFGQKGKYLKSFLAWLDGNPRQKAALRMAMDAEASEGVPSLLISYTSTKFSCARILFASESVKHIRENAMAVRRKLSEENVRLVHSVLDAYRGAHDQGAMC